MISEVELNIYPPLAILGFETRNSANTIQNGLNLIGILRVNSMKPFHCMIYLVEFLLEKQNWQRDNNMQKSVMFFFCFFSKKWMGIRGLRTVKFPENVELNIYYLRDNMWEDGIIHYLSRIYSSSFSPVDSTEVYEYTAKNKNIFPYGKQFMMENAIILCHDKMWNRKNINVYSRKVYTK